VLVTGGGGAVGGAVCRLLAAEGWHVVVADRRGDAAERVAEQVGATLPPGAIVDTVQVDVADPDSGRVAVVARTGRIDALVNNAAVQHRAGLEELTVAQWDDAMAVNVRGPFLLAREITPLWRRQGGGRIVNVGSRVWTAGGPPAYVTSKAALVGLTRSLATELGPIGVTVNTVAPGFMDTPFTTGRLAAADAAALRAQQSTISPLGRVADVADVAGAIAFLLSERAAFVTGEVLHVAGGAQMAPIVRTPAPPSVTRPPATTGAP
jgi:3-oxoacyl-[acyl-carrier protein] reductase